MYSDTEKFVKEIIAASNIPNQRAAAKVVYGKVADIIPIPEKVQEMAEATWKKNKADREARFNKLVELKAPEVIIENEKKLMAKVETFAIWLKKTKIGSAFRKIHGING